MAKHNGVVRVAKVKKKHSPPIGGGEKKAQTRQQQRAAFSYREVVKIKGQDTDCARRFRSYAEGFPAKVQMNGLGQALAFAKSKSAGKNTEAQAWGALYTLVSTWLCQEGGSFPDSDDALTGIIDADMHVYRQAQAETQALMVWVKQFARAEIMGDN